MRIPERYFDMPHNSTVSVIIIFLNAIDFLQEAVESVLAQTYEHWELLLVDDGSSDPSSALARDFADQDPSRICYLEHAGHQNLGMSASRNLGIRNATGFYIAFLDADDYWLPDRLKTHVGILDLHPEVGMLYGTAKYWYSWTGLLQDRDRDFVPDLRVKENTLFAPPQLLLLLLNGRAEVPCTCSILVRREVAQKVMGFEESFRGMYEDQVFYAKVCLLATVMATSDCLAWYRQHPKSNLSTAVSSGQTYVLHYNFLRWLENYCLERMVKDAGVWQAIRRQLWLYAGPSQKNIRWLKKWILRLEEQFFSSKLRNRLWIRK